MGEMYVARRANGEPFTEQLEGKIRIPVWRSTDAVARYKARNPELGVYLPARLDRSLIKKIRALGVEGTAEFFLLSDDDPGADLNAGRPIKEEDLFPESDATSHTANTLV